MGERARPARKAPALARERPRPTASLPVPDNFSLGPPTAPNAHSPGSGTDNGSLGRRRGPSETLTGLAEHVDRAKPGVAGAVEPRTGLRERGHVGDDLGRIVDQAWGPQANSPSTTCGRRRAGYRNADACDHDRVSFD